MLRRLRSALARLAAEARAKTQRRSNVTIGKRVRFGAGVRCWAVPGARILISDGVEIGSASSVAAIEPGAQVIIGSKVFIAGNCIIAAAEQIAVGRESMIAEMVSVRDHDHDPASPPRTGRKLSKPVSIGQRVWVGAKASIVRGGDIGDDAVIGAHALVNRPIPPNALAAGVPALVKRTGLRPGTRMSPASGDLASP